MTVIILLLTYSSCCSWVCSVSAGMYFNVCIWFELLTKSVFREIWIEELIPLNAYLWGDKPLYALHSPCRTTSSISSSTIGTTISDFDSHKASKFTGEKTKFWISEEENVHKGVGATWGRVSKWWHFFGVKQCQMKQWQSTTGL